MVKIITGRNLGVAAPATSIAIVITESNRMDFTLAALAVVVIGKSSSVPRLALVATMAIMSIELLTAFARASYYGPSVVVILELAEPLAAVVVVATIIMSC